MLVLVCAAELLTYGWNGMKCCLSSSSILPVMMSVTSITVKKRDKRGLKLRHVNNNRCLKALSIKSLSGHVYSINCEVCLQALKEKKIPVLVRLHKMHVNMKVCPNVGRLTPTSSSVVKWRYSSIWELVSSAHALHPSYISLTWKQKYPTELFIPSLLCRSGQ